MAFKPTIITHGGAGSAPQDSDGPEAAAAAGLELMKKGGPPLEAVTLAVKMLEDDPRFNAGTGSRRRIDGSTIELDASCMTSDHKFGAVACVEGVRNPIEIAKGVLLKSDHICLAGDGALIFARENNIPLAPLDSSNAKSTEDAGSPSCDTVGAVAFDGKTFAAALSTGGLKDGAIGRVSDVPMPGCGLFCGPLGAVACTGDGEFIAMKILARQVYEWLASGVSPDMAAEKAIALFDDPVDIGLIILTENDFSADARRGMAWSHLHAE